MKKIGIRILALKEEEWDYFGIIDMGRDEPKWLEKKRPLVSKKFFKRFEEIQELAECYREYIWRKIKRYGKRRRKI